MITELNNFIEKELSKVQDELDRKFNEKYNNGYRHALLNVKDVANKLSIHNVGRSADSDHCDKCEDVQGFYLGTSCPKCDRPFRSVKQ